MSWIDKIKDDIIITCGDGVSYQPSWLNASKQLEWNVAMFEFPELEGTLVKKSKKLGTKYHLELYFQGADHLELSKAFEASANDPRPWRIAHPFYGTLNVQAPAFTVDNTGLNVSKWTGTVIETILEVNPRTAVDPIDAIAIQKNILDESFAQALLVPPTTIDVATMKQTNRKNYNLTVPVITIPEEAENYFNLFNKANSAVNTATASPLLAMRTVVSMINAPALFAISATNRIGLLNRQFVELRKTVSGLANPSSKQIYQNLGGTIISSMVLASTLPLPDEFVNSSKSLQLIDQISAAFDDFMTDLDSLQTANGGSPGSFIPDATSIIQLNQLINLGISNLFTIALSSKNERSVICEADTNIIILTHRFYGLDANDNNINELIANNNLGLNGLLQIKKATKIVYYI